MFHRRPRPMLKRLFAHRVFLLAPVLGLSAWAPTPSRFGNYGGPMVTLKPVEVGGEDRQARVVA